MIVRVEENSKTDTCRRRSQNQHSKERPRTAKTAINPHAAESGRKIKARSMKEKKLHMPSHENEKEKDSKILRKERRKESPRKSGTGRS